MTEQEMIAKKMAEQKILDRKLSVHRKSGRLRHFQVSYMCGLDLY
jgi:hypothetical protein